MSQYKLNIKEGTGNREQEIGKTVPCSLFPVPFFDKINRGTKQLEKLFCP